MRLVREEYIEAEGFYKASNPSQSYRYILCEWTYYYNNGDVNTVTMRKKL